MQSTENCGRSVTDTMDNQLTTIVEIDGHGRIRDDDEGGVDMADHFRSDGPRRRPI